MSRISRGRLALVRRSRECRRSVGSYRLAPVRKVTHVVTGAARDNTAEIAPLNLCQFLLGRAAWVSSLRSDQKAFVSGVDPGRSLGLRRRPFDKKCARRVAQPRACLLGGRAFVRLMKRVRRP